MIPRIENTYPLDCECGENRLSLTHIFFYCPLYTIQRLPLINMLQNDNMSITMKSLLSDNDKYCKSVIKFLNQIKFIDKI